MTLTKKALSFATAAHKGQTRKVNGMPYITHPIRVAGILATAGFPDEVIAAGYLHDVVEDTQVTVDDIRKEFGNTVASLASAHTEDKSKSWEERKQHTIDGLKTAPLEVKALIAADKLDNLNSLMEDYEEIGDALWGKFKRGVKDQKWYYENIIMNLMSGINIRTAPPFFFELIEKTESFFENF